MPSTPSEFAPWLGVFETLRVEEGVPLFLEEHRTELRRSAIALGLNPPSGFDAAELQGRSGRWRWIVTAEGARTLFSEEPPPPAGPIALSVSTVRVGSQNWDARFKTASYLAHAQARRVSATPETILLNERGEVASAASANIFWRRGKQIYTPAHEAGCRCGVVRGFVLSQDPVEEGYFRLDELSTADEIFLTNSLRGIASVNFLEGVQKNDFSKANALRERYAKAIEAMRVHPWRPRQHANRP